MPVPRHRAARAVAAAALVGLLASRAEPGTPALLAAGAVPDAAGGDERPVCDGLPLVASAAALANDNREPAGNVHDGVLSLRLEAREVAWYPEGPDGCAVPVRAFAEEDRPARIPGPLIRVRAGTEVRATLRNTLPAPIRVRGLQDRDTDTLMCTSRGWSVWSRDVAGWRQVHFHESWQAGEQGAGHSAPGGHPR